MKNEIFYPNDPSDKLSLPVAADTPPVTPSSSATRASSGSAPPTRARAATPTATPRCGPQGVYDLPGHHHDRRSTSATRSTPSPRPAS